MVRPLRKVFIASSLIKTSANRKYTFFMTITRLCPLRASRGNMVQENWEWKLIFFKGSFEEELQRTGKNHSDWAFLAGYKFQTVKLSGGWKTIIQLLQ